MDKCQIIKVIVKLYFLGAIAGSFTHIMEAAHKVGLTGWEAWSAPFMIDGLAIIGMVMRSVEFSKATQRIGFRVQVVMGLMSLVANCYAASNLGGVIYGVAIVALFLAAEWLSEQLESAKEAETKDQALRAAQKRSASASKAAATRKRNAQRKAKEIKELEKMVK